MSTRRGQTREENYSDTLLPDGGFHGWRTGKIDKRQFLALARQHRNADGTVNLNRVWEEVLSLPPGSVHNARLSVVRRKAGKKGRR